MSTPGGVFLSAVTSEFGEARDIVASDLRSKKFNVTVQSDFAQEGGTLLDKLDEYIRDCAAVVCIVGRRSGSLPTLKSSAKYVEMLPDPLEQASYTQWEVVFAHHYGKKIFVYHATDDYTPDQPQPTGEDHPDLQTQFVTWLSSLDREWSPFSDVKDLQINVFRTNLESIAGTRREASLTGDGLDVEEAKGPRIERRGPDSPPRPLPAHKGAFVGRSSELEELADAIDGRAEQLIALTGAAGMGRKSLLKQATNRTGADPPFKDGTGVWPEERANVSPMVEQDDDDVLATKLEDLRQAIWEQFFTAGDPSLVDTTHRKQGLRELEALVALPDADAATPAVEMLLDDMAHTTFCITAPEEHVVELDRAYPIPVDGLFDDDELIDLFASRYGDVPDEARTDVAALCDGLEGNPALILQLANTARLKARYNPKRDTVHPLIAWARDQRDLPPDDVREEFIPADEQRVAQAGEGGHVPRMVLVDVAGSDDVVDRALDSGRMVAASPRYRLSQALEPSDVDRAELDEQLFAGARRWVDDADLGEIYENREFVLRMIDWGIRSGHDRQTESGPDSAQRSDGRWSEVIDFAVAAEPAMALGGRHGAWDQLLRGVETAARARLDAATNLDRGSGGAPGAPGSPPDGAGRSSAPSDSDDTAPTESMGADAALGWALHQRGSRALLRDELKDARYLLNTALPHRRSDEGRALTRKNLMLIPFAVIPIAALLFLTLLVVPIAAAAWVGFDDSPATTDITPDVLVLSEESREQSFEVRNVGTGPAWILDISLDGEGDDDAATAFEIVDDDPDRCRKNNQIPTDQPCTVTVRSLGRPAAALLRIDVTSRSGNRDGDRSAVLISEP